MTPSPLNHLKRRRAEQMYRDGGWGPLRSWPVQRSGGEPLVFQVRLPVVLELIEVGRLARNAPGAPAVLGAATMALERAADAAGVVVVGALRPTTVPEAERGALATMTVAFSEITGSPAVEDFLPADSEQAREADVEVTRLSDKVTRIKRLSLESLGEGFEPAPVLLIQYLIETRYGALVAAFSTTDPEMMGEWGRKLYRQIVETMFIGERPIPY
jgi:hypothetical protein